MEKVEKVNLGNSVAGVMVSYTGQCLGAIQLNEIPVKGPDGSEGFVELIPGGNAIFQLTEAFLKSYRDGQLRYYLDGGGREVSWDAAYPPLKCYMLLNM